MLFHVSMKDESGKADIGRVLRRAASRLREAGIETPELDAQVLMAHALGTDRVAVIAAGPEALDPERVAAMEALVERRASGEPVAYITGVREFYSLEFLVDENVLIPRPETELLVDLAVYHTPPGGALLDCGTGSGAIAVSAGYSRPDISLFASDISAEAVRMAGLNAERILPGRAFRLLRGDLLSPFRPASFDVIAANPPYVDIGMKDSLQREVLREPGTALFAEDGGRAVIGRIIPAAAACLREGGCLLVEIGDGMRDYVIRLGGEFGYAVSVLADYGGLPRAAVLKR